MINGTTCGTMNKKERQVITMKKFLCFFLALITLCSLLGACNSAAPAETTEVKETKPTMNNPSKPDPATDGTLRILMVGNSFCYYYTEELYELLMENLPEGVTAVEIYNLYYSGCSLTRHSDWWYSNTGEYDLFKVSINGRENLAPQKQWTLENALKMANWDYISLQGTAQGVSYLSGDPTENSLKTAALAEPILNRFHELYPQAQLLWHRTWFFEVGRVSGDYTYKAEDGPKYDAGIQAVCDYMCNEFDQDKDYDLQIVNSGVAWAKARELNETRNLLPLGGLCARLGVMNLKTYPLGEGHPDPGDGYHDGDIGGAQLLNAYVWYMTITGERDLSKSNYKPVYVKDGIKYPLSDEMIAMLKEAAESVFAN